jgi:hypothetical protein
MLRSTDRTVSVAGIADPATCGEDVAGNLRRMISIAPAHCPDCADYHITNAAVRLLDRAPWKRARPALLDALAPLLAEVGARGSAPIDVVIAGSADTAVLSTSGHAAWAAGDGIFRRTRFTVLDRCPSPLVLCDDYGARNGLRVHTEAVDLTSTAKAFPADIIVVHHLLPFVAEDQVAGLLRRLGGWLKEGGRLVLWHDVAPRGDEEANRRVKAARIAEIKARVGEGDIAISEPADVLFARLDKYVGAISEDPSSLAELESVKDLIASTGLAIRSLDVSPHSCPSRARRYLMIVAERRPLRS